MQHSYLSVLRAEKGLVRGSKDSPKHEGVKRKGMNDCNCACNIVFNVCLSLSLSVRPSVCLSVYLVLFYLFSSYLSSPLLSYLVVSYLIRRPLPWPKQGRRLGPPEVWNLLCHGHGPHIPATIACLCFSGLPSFKGLERAAATPTTKPSRRPFQGNSRSYTPQPSVFQGVETLFPRRQTLQTLPSNPSAGLSKATLAFKGVQDCRLPAFKPLKPSRRPSAGLSKATLAATRPSHLSCVQNSF